ncbi:28517_t:CDS:2, partial [Racocetra persica]
LISELSHHYWSHFAISGILLGGEVLLVVKFSSLYHYLYGEDLFVDIVVIVAIDIDYINMSNTNSNVQEIPSFVSSSDIDLIIDEIKSTNSKNQSLSKNTNQITSPNTISNSGLSLVSNIEFDQDKSQVNKDRVYEDDEDSNSDFKVIEKSEQNKQKKRKR